MKSPDTMGELLISGASIWPPITPPIAPMMIDTMVPRFREIQTKHGPDSLGVLGTGQLVTEEFYTLGKLVQLGFGKRNYDGNTTLCMASAVSG